MSEIFARAEAYREQSRRMAKRIKKRRRKGTGAV